MFHFTYMTIDPNTGQYYVGRHTTKKVDDGYVGSGLWVLNHPNPSSLTREVLFFYNTFEELKDAEKNLLEEHVGRPKCMNRNKSSVGFASGVDNPNCQPHRRVLKSEQFSGEGNPMFGKKRSTEFVTSMKQRTGSNNPFYGKTHSEERKRKHSERMKEYWKSKRDYIIAKAELEDQQNLPAQPTDL